MVDSTWRAAFTFEFAEIGEKALDAINAGRWYDPTVQHLLIITILLMKHAFEAHRQEVECSCVEQIHENNGQPVPAALDFYDGTQ